MKLVEGNGRELTVRDAGPVLVHLRAKSVPIKFNGRRVMEDDEARELVLTLLDSKLYERLV